MFTRLIIPQLLVACFDSKPEFSPGDEVLAAVGDGCPSNEKKLKNNVLEPALYQIHNPQSLHRAQPYQNFLKAPVDDSQTCYVGLYTVSSDQNNCPEDSLFLKGAQPFQELCRFADEILPENYLRTSLNGTKLTPGQEVAVFSKDNSQSVSGYLDVLTVSANKCANPKDVLLRNDLGEICVDSSYVYASMKEASDAITQPQTLKALPNKLPIHISD